VPVPVVPVPEVLPELVPPPELPVWAETETGKDAEAKLMAKRLATTALDKSKCLMIMVPCMLLDSCGLLIFQTDISYSIYYFMK
ncbi:hypothetical protein H1Q63_18230, partial [Desmonostoc muscorum CCALA 125]|nr:hypothetical protein [Desmonostoc muscorum CCALA 125]